jgi:hypothetical protein
MLLRIEAAVVVEFGINIDVRRNWLAIQNISSSGRLPHAVSVTFLGNISVLSRTVTDALYSPRDFNIYQRAAPREKR